MKPLRKILMANVYAKTYTVDSMTCPICNGTSEMLTPINNSTTTFIVSKCIYCEKGLARLYRIEELPLDEAVLKNIR